MIFLDMIPKRDYYLQALRAGNYRHKRWILECFTRVENMHGEREYELPLHRDEKHYYFIDPQTQRQVALTDTHDEHGPYRLMDELILEPGDLANVKERTVTTYGNALFNSVALIYAFGDKVPFMTGRLKVTDVEKRLEPRLIGNHDTPTGSKNLTIAEYKRYNEGMRFLSGLTQMCVPSATYKTLTIDPSVIRRRAELLKQHAGELDDPIVQARITQELVKLDRESFKGDPGERFYIKDKSFEVVRKRTHIFVGEESGFGKKGKFIPTSLAEGWNIEELPSMANAMREGSHSRGSRTALGGVEAKNNYRIFQNTVVAEDDCGTTLGLRITLSKFMAKYWLSHYVIEKDGTNVELTEENLAQYTGRPIVIRSPSYCKTAKQNLCGKCVGSRIAKMPTSISTLASENGSTFLQLLLAAAHRVALKSSKFDYKAMLS